ncbi:unnamed protein product [Protopolystoma xenopodis]|uniref:Uncharacterized protein n=1 Tax=Protopolystoma xenopodis TaxID=117903 RepID=A0A3S5AIN2_9PLAT|nr:unnamed protein product [Protopolystoma xenopodis]
MRGQPNNSRSPRPSNTPARLALIHSPSLLRQIFPFRLVRKYLMLCFVSASKQHAELGQGAGARTRAPPIKCTRVVCCGANPLDGSPPHRYTPSPHPHPPAGIHLSKRPLPPVSPSACTISSRARVCLHTCLRVCKVGSATGGVCRLCRALIHQSRGARDNCAFVRPGDQQHGAPDRRCSGVRTAVDSGQRRRSSPPSGASAWLRASRLGLNDETAAPVPGVGMLRPAIRLTQGHYRHKLSQLLCQNAH